MLKIVLTSSYSFLLSLCFLNLIRLSFSCIKVSVSDGKGGTVQTEIGIIVSEIVDKSGLEALVEEAEQTEAELDRYADGEAKEKFVTALEQAYEILNSEADADSVRNAEEALKEAM